MNILAWTFIGLASIAFFVVLAISVRTWVLLPALIGAALIAFFVIGGGAGVILGFLFGGMAILLIYLKKKGMPD